MEKFQLRSEQLSVDIISWGCTITALHVKDRQGKASDVVLGFAELEGGSRPALGCQTVPGPHLLPILCTPGSFRPLRGLDRGPQAWGSLTCKRVNGLMVAANRIVWLEKPGSNANSCRTWPPLGSRTSHGSRGSQLRETKLPRVIFELWATGCVEPTPPLCFSEEGKQRRAPVTTPLPAPQSDFLGGLLEQKCLRM